MPPGIEVPRFEKYGGKGDHVSHAYAFTTLCCDIFLEENILARLFHRSLKDTALDWFS
jgi:hypothetical protein